MYSTGKFPRGDNLVSVQNTNQCWQLYATIRTTSVMPTARHPYRPDYLIGDRSTTTAFTGTAGRGPQHKAQAAAADDHERRQASNPYHLLPHLRPESPATHFPSSTATRDLNYHNEPTSTSNTSSTDGQPPRVEQQQGRTRVRFQLPANHREYPPQAGKTQDHPTENLRAGTTVQLRIDGVLNNPVVLIDNRPAYMIPQPESSDAGTSPNKREG